MPDPHVDAGRPNAGPETGKKAEEEPVLTGTFVSVLLVGAVITVCWLAVLYLFVSRN
ncbi:cytochrome c oxidase subunit 2A [Cohnella sp. REN36]|uniref:cytochrome c oxidase subunit 2A n=1 Tax=Cohnella sp. REN36 TaxID=2887347 RepID=UPI001D15AD91|nr:cytochrome c oxidase subunit 2A [Cohnella sp. REN36]MCC3375960.1 cytochrome c oxidase subunit 2A [Cohnella sp. REN36]